MRKLAIPIFVFGLALPLSGTAWAAGGPGDTAPPPAAEKSAVAATANLPDAPKPAAAATAATPALESQLAELRALLNAQAAEIEAQRRELAEMKARLGEVKAEAVTAAVSASVPAATAAVVKAADPDEKPEGPKSLHFKGITITPMGFFVAETVYRNRAVDSDVNTAFTSIPYSGANLAHVSEFNASGRQSRIASLFEGKIASAKIGGYYEADFLSAGVTSNNRQSNSYTLRQRQFWAQVALDSGWTFTGGQMWSLVTETKKGLNNRTEAAPSTIDAQYTAGFSWARQYGFRVTKDFNNKVWLGFSIEGAQEVLPSFHNNAANFILQDAGNGGGLYNSTTNYTLNTSPDFVFKAAWEPGWGHYELFGLVRTFRSRYFPCIVPTGITAPTECTGAPSTTSFATNDTRAGGGMGFNARVPLFDKKVDVGFHVLYGDGVGRYGTVGLPDLTVRPNGTIVPLHAGQGLGTIEWHATPKLDIYLNGGGDYVGRAYYITQAGTPTAPPVTIGYGSPYSVNSSCQSPNEVPPGAVDVPAKPSGSSCTNDLRSVIEGTAGFWHKIYKGDKGTVQWGLQYSYVTLAAWSGLGTPGVAGVFPQYHPHANDNLFFSSFRYYIP
jgi:hypothetical protein